MREVCTAESGAVVRVQRGIGRWLLFLDGAQVFRSRIYVFTWVPVSVAVIAAESPHPDVGRWWWAVAVTAATAIGWVFHIVVGRLVTRVQRAAIRRPLIPLSFAVIGLVRGATLGALAETFALLDDHFWGVRIVGGLLGGVVLMSSVAAVERAGVLLVELQRESRALQRRYRASTPADSAAATRTWAEGLRTVILAHFDEQPWTEAGREVIERGGPSSLIDRLSAVVPRVPVDTVGQSERPRLSPAVQVRNLVGLATVRPNGAAAPLAVTMPLAVIAVHGGAARSVDDFAVTVMIALIVSVVSGAGAAVLQAGLRLALRRAPSAVRIVAITVAIAALGAATGSSAALAYRWLVSDERPTVESLLAGVLPVTVLIVGWSAVVLNGVGRYAALLQAENERLLERLDVDQRHRARAMDALAARLERCVQTVIAPLIEVIALHCRANDRSWASPHTRDRVLVAVEAVAATAPPRALVDTLDAIGVAWARLVLIDIYVDDEVACAAADLTHDEVAELVGRVHVAIGDAVFRRDAETLEATLLFTRGRLVLEVHGAELVPPPALP